jgi:hypothetical protein
MIVSICLITGDSMFHTFHLMVEDPLLSGGGTLKKLKALVVKDFCQPRWRELDNPLIQSDDSDWAFDYYFDNHPKHFPVFTAIKLELANVVSNPNAEWANDAVQFPRLITEARDIGLFDEKSVQTLGFHMSLKTDQVNDLIDRAAKQLEKARLEISEELFI